jgi:hypothetical protein
MRKKGRKERRKEGILKQKKLKIRTATKRKRNVTCK